MNRDPALQKKQILSDPVAVFTSHYPNADSTRKNQLNDIFKKMGSVKAEFEDIQEQTNIISRKIGEAKKSNQSADELIRAMQEYSAKKKQIATDLGDLEKQILAFFILKEDEDSKEIHAQKNTVTQRYTTSSVVIEDITINLLDHKGPSKEKEVWNNYAAKHPAGTIHHRIEWQDVLNNTYNLECYYFFATDINKDIVGILPLTRLKSPLFGDLLVSMPYFQRGGAIADHPLIEQKLMQAANNLATKLNIDHIEYRDDIERKELPAQSHKVNMVLALPDSEKDLWNSFTPKLRAQIKRPQRESPRVLIGGKEHLDDFYKVYMRNMRDLGSPAHSKLFVENILDSFENSCLVILKLKNKPVSAGLLLGQGDTMEIPLASTIRTVNSLSMNMLLYWEVLKLAIAKGYKRFDFGRSSKDAGTYRFKQQWGAQPLQLHWHYWLSEGNELPSINPSNPKYALVINIWKRLPIALTQWLGPAIVKNIP